MDIPIIVAGDNIPGMDDSFHTSALHNSPSVTRIPAMALPLQEGPETCSRNVGSIINMTMHGL